MVQKASHRPKAQDEADRRPFAWRPQEVWQLARAAGREFVEDKCPKRSAALAYYTLFAIGPLLVLSIGVASLAFGAEAARLAVLSQLTQFVGESGASGIASLLAGADRGRVGIIGTAIGLVVLLLSAGAVFAQLKEALNRIWEVEAKKAVGFKAKAIRAIRKNFLSFAGVIGTGFLLLVSLVLSTLLAALGERVTAALPATELLAQTLHFAISLVVVSAVFAAMFKFLPDVRVAWRDVAVGAVITAALFLLGQFALSYYLGAGPLSTRYGQGGALVVILVWVYYSSMIVFFGAEITQVFANRYGSHIRESRDARPLAQAIVEEQDAPEKEGIDEGRGRDAGRSNPTRGRRPT